MMDLEEIEKAIEEHEQMRTSLQACERLAWLYIVRDHLSNKDNSVKDNSPTSERNIDVAESEFGKLIRSKSQERVMAVIEELMQTIEVINPRLYAGTIQRIKDI